MSVVVGNEVSIITLDAPSLGLGSVSAKSNLSGLGQTPEVPPINHPIIIYEKTGDSIIVDVTYYDSRALRHDLYRSTSPMGNNSIGQGVRVGSDIDPEQSFIDTFVTINNTYYYKLISSRLNTG